MGKNIIKNNIAVSKGKKGILNQILDEEKKKEEKKTNISIVQTDKIERIEKRDY